MDQVMKKDLFVYRFNLSDILMIQSAHETSYEGYSVELFITKHFGKKLSWHCPNSFFCLLNKYPSLQLLD
jgi:hypothetical protein